MRARGDGASGKLFGVNEVLRTPLARRMIGCNRSRTVASLEEETR